MIGRSISRQMRKRSLTGADVVGAVGSDFMHYNKCFSWMEAGVSVK